MFLCFKLIEMNIVGEHKFTKNQVKDVESGNMRGPALCDVAPTVLQVMGLPVPSEMTGQSLLA